MANATIEAELKLTAKDQTAAAFRSMAGRMKQIEKTSQAYNRTQAGRVAMIQKQVEAHNRVGQAVHRSESAIVGYGKAMGALAAVGGIAAVAKSSISFEESLFNVGKKAGISGDALKRLGEEAKALSTSGEVASPLSEIMAGYERAAAAGIPISEMKEFVLLTTKVADAFEMAGDESANAFLGFNKTIGLAFGDMEKFADLINSLADSGIADESGIVNFVDRAGAGLKSFGLSKEQIAALGATSANIKMPDDVAANALTTLTGKLLSPGSEKAEKALAGIVGNIANFRKLLKTDANKALETFLENVGKLDKFKGAELMSDFIGAGFDDEILRYAAAIDEVRRNRELAEGTSWFGSLDASYQGKLKLATSQLQIFQNELGKLAIDVGTMGLPFLTSSLETIKGVVRDIGDGMDTFGRALDMPEISRAGQALADLQAATGAFLDTDPSQSAIAKFFQEMAQAANQIAGAINAVNSHFNRPEDAMVPRDQLTPDQQQMRDDYMTRFMPDAQKRLQNKDAGLPNLGSGKGARIGGITEPDPARFGNELRDAMEQGGSSVQAAGVSAGAAIAESGDAIAAKITAAGDAAGASMANSIRAAVAGGVRVVMPPPPLPRANAAGATLADRAAARTMVDAGVAGHD